MFAESIFLQFHTLQEQRNSITNMPGGKAFDQNASVQNECIYHKFHVDPTQDDKNILHPLHR